MIKTVHHHVNTQQDVEALLHFLTCPNQLLENFLHCAQTVGAGVGFDAVYLSLREDWRQAGALPAPAGGGEPGERVP